MRILSLPYWKNVFDCRSLLVMCCAAVSLSLPGCASDLDMLPPGTVQLTGEQEVPAVNTTATASGVITASTSKIISGTITTKGINATAAHIHLAPAGSNGPIIISLTKTGESTWAIAQNTKLSDTEYIQYIVGNFYVNVHSQAYPAGEIRGQILAN